MECEHCGEFIDNPWENGNMYDGCFYCTECYEDITEEDE